MTRSYRRLSKCLWIAPLLASCGGGGGGSGGGQLPVASFTATAYAGEQPLDVSFDASASHDPDGRIVGYSWSFGDGTSATEAVVAQRYAEAGTYRVTLTVTDDAGNRSSKSAVVTAVAAGPDPLYSNQWHLHNTGQVEGLVGADINVEPVWQSCGDASCRGGGVRIAVVDDGLQLMHPDLSANIVNGASYNYLNGTDDPSPPDDSRHAHGTAVAGLAAALDNNSTGGRGAAPRAELVGYNVLQNATSINQADAMTRGRDVVGVSTNSWGAPDGTGRLQPSSLNWRTAIETGLAEGRGGLGTVYTWAAGNGHLVRTSSGLPVEVDNSNYDGQANFYGVMAVGAVDIFGVKASYSETGANLWVVAPGGDAACGERTITTTDLTGDAGFNPGFSTKDLADADYTRCMNGTSAATPLVAGVAALVLQANPSLTWRDVRAILAKTAVKTDPEDALGWTTNGGGYSVNHKYGFGLIDAQAAVQEAKTWPLLPPMRTVNAPASGVKSVNATIADNDEGGAPTDTMTVGGSGIGSLEWVDVEFVSNHDYAGDLEIILTSPSGTVSRLSETHPCRDNQCAPAITDANGVWRWRFGSARHLGEVADGNWTLRVADKATGQNIPGTGEWISWRLVLRGH